MKMAKQLKEQVREKEDLVIKQTDLSDIFGKIKFKETAQELKDEGRKGWKEKQFS